MLWSVAVSSRPPNVMIGVRHAKYMKKNEARHWTCKASLKSLKYHGILRSTSLRNPPKSLHNKTVNRRTSQTTLITYTDETVDRRTSRTALVTRTRQSTAGHRRQLSLHTPTRQSTAGHHGQLSLHGRDSRPQDIADSCRYTDETVDRRTSQTAFRTALVTRTRQSTAAYHRQLSLHG